MVAAGFEASGVGLLDPRVPGARDAVLGMVRTAQTDRQRLCVHCADGTSLVRAAPLRSSRAALQLSLRVAPGARRLLPPLAYLFSSVFFLAVRVC